VCDLSYTIQVEQIRDRALAEMTLAPYAEDASNIDTPDTAVAEFDRWLFERPEELDRDEDDEELRSLIGVR
jgi:hypothetical protein